MKLSAPKSSTFYVGLILWAAALLSPFVPVLDNYAFQGLSAGYVFGVCGGLILILGNVLDGF